MNTRPLLNVSELPRPRLELRWDEENAPPPEGYPTGSKACRYLLVLPLSRWDLRREDENGEQVRGALEMEIRCTIRGGGGPDLIDEDRQVIDTPFRDHSHATWDSHVLKLPAYVTAGERAMLLDPVEPKELLP